MLERARGANGLPRRKERAGRIGIKLRCTETQMREKIVQRDSREGNAPLDAFLEDGVGFEPTEDSSPSEVFKTSALNRSATHPPGG